MHEAQRMVRNFHRALDIPHPCACQPTMPSTVRRALRAELIREEAQETIDALQKGLLVPTIDGLCDLLVVVYGTAVEMGVDLEPFFEEVHESNMAKRGGPTRADGKKLKPEGWVGPDIVGILKTGKGQYVG